VMRKSRLFVIVFALCMTALYGAAEEKVIVIGSGKGFRPMMFLNDDQAPDGMHVELWRLMGERGGFKPEFTLGEWHRCIPALLAGEVDLVHGVSYTESRAEILDFSKVIYEYRVFMYFNKDMIAMNDISDLNGMSIGAQRGDSKVIEFIKEHTKNTTVVEYNTIHLLLTAAEANEVKVFVYADEALLWCVSRDHPDFAFRRSLQPLYTDQIHAAVRKGDQETLDLINQSIDLIKPEDRERIREKWGGTSIYDPLPMKAIKTAVYISAALVFIVLVSAVLALRSRGIKLKRLLAERKAMFLDLHHHVRNNLAVILGFIEMKKAGGDTKGTEALLDNLSNRIYAIAAVHDQISGSSNIREVDVAPLLKDIVTNIKDMHDAPHISIELQVATSESLSLARAVSFCLLVNEIIENAYCHAFPNGENGLIDIKVITRNDKTVLAVKDNGVGMDKELLDAPQSTGIALIKLLAETIEGVLSIETDSGCSYKLEFAHAGEIAAVSVATSFP
ncbi:transporter substrate-binding domain-containing protein, partial [Planctomycetota bacterium]